MQKENTDKPKKVRGYWIQLYQKIKTITPLIGYTLLLFAIVTTIFVVIEVLLKGKAITKPVDLIFMGGLSFLFVISAYLTQKRRLKREAVHRNGESWKD